MAPNAEEIFGCFIWDHEITKNSVFHLSCYSNIPGKEKSNGEIIDKQATSPRYRKNWEKGQKEPTEAFRSQPHDRTPPENDRQESQKVDTLFLFSVEVN